MWADNDTDRDFLNFSGVADTVAAMILQAKGRPVSIGVSGQWGVGKSSMIRMIRSSLEKGDSTKKQFVFVEFNAWLYQGYDDARAALMDVIASKLEKAAEDNPDLLLKAKALLRRINWLRVGKMVASSAVSLSLGVPPAGLIGGLWDIGKRVLGSEEASEPGGEKQDGDKDDKKGNDSEKLLKDPPSPSREIQELRDSFEETLKELEITLVVLIDDLDRCLPPTTISTLEAIRLFLFLKNTAFVVAADDAMIKHAVSKHFEGIEDKQVINYFDKLIQVPVRVPPLGTQEVRAYLVMLFIEDSELDESTKERIREAIGAQLRLTWQGKRVDRGFINGLLASYPPALVARFDMADRLAPIMINTSGIQGNPRLIKRFLNALSIRMSLARAQGVTVDEAVLAKLMLFERLGKEGAYQKIIAAVTGSTDGKPGFLAQMEEEATGGTFKADDPLFDDAFTKEWLKLEPSLADQDLRGAVYVSRDHLPIITSENTLSAESTELLQALLANPSTAKNFKAQLAAVPRADLAVFMDRLLIAAKREQEWGTPDILTACLVVAEQSETQRARLTAFFRGLPNQQIKPGLIPKIQDQPWARELFKYWLKQDVSTTVKRAIAAAEKG